MTGFRESTKFSKTRIFGYQSTPSVRSRYHAAHPPSRLHTTWPSLHSELPPCILGLNVEDEVLEFSCKAGHQVDQEGQSVSGDDSIGLDSKKLSVQSPGSNAVRTARGYLSASCMLCSLNSGFFVVDCMFQGGDTDAPLSALAS